MAVAQTGAIYKAMTIDGESSRTYGVYITGSAVYNAPAREVEMVSVPGRNGQLALDKGRFENIEVTYPAGIYADTEEDFAEAVSNFRNYLCSRNGYVRIEDDYNPDEYRMGIYKSGLEVETAGHKAGEFEITFDCKPQRWLKSGETAITVATGDVVANPTLFGSHPLIEAEGEGTINVSGQRVNLIDGVMGNITLRFPSNAVSISPSRYLYNLGDRSRILNNSVFSTEFIYNGVEGGGGAIHRELDDYERTFTLLLNDFTTTVKVSNGILRITTVVNTVQYVPLRSGGYSWSTAIPDFSLSYSRIDDNTGEVIGSGREDLTNVTVNLFFTSPWGYVGLSHELDEDESYSARFRINSNAHESDATLSISSTAPALGHPTYIDTEAGEAYKIENEQYISLNRYVDLGSDLPKLEAGANTITFDSSITSLKMVPRWWKV